MGTQALQTLTQQNHPRQRGSNPSPQTGMANQLLLRSLLQFLIGIIFLTVVMVLVQSNLHLIYVQGGL